MISDWKLHRLQKYLNCWWADLTWNVLLCDRVNSLSQKLHLYFNPLWRTLICLFNSPWRVNCFPHSWQLSFISLWILLIHLTTMCNLMCSKILYSNLYDWYSHWGSMSLTSVCHILQAIFFWCAFCEPLLLYVVYVQTFRTWKIKG